MRFPRTVEGILEVWREVQWVVWEGAIESMKRKELHDPNAKIESATRRVKCY